MKTYTIQLVIEEGCDEFWQQYCEENKILDDSKPHIQEVIAVVEDCLNYQIFGAIFKGSPIKTEITYD